jgi:hypothetical protein
MQDLENLLILDGEIFPMDNGFWVKFEAHRIEPSMKIPHGIRYSLTLHDRYNQRVLGYDNAHRFKPTAKYGGKKETWDHIHKKLDVFPYEFESAVQLMEDFWKSAEEYMARYER